MVAIGAPVARLYQPLAPGCRSRTALISGGVKSTDTSKNDCVTEFPATSVTVPVACRCCPSPNVKGLLTLLTPEPPSLPLKVAVGAPVARLYQPVAPGCLLRLALIVGAIVSILTDKEAELLLTFPSASVAVAKI